MSSTSKDIIERLRHANMAHGGLDVEKLVPRRPDRGIRGDRSPDDRARAWGRREPRRGSDGGARRPQSAGTVNDWSDEQTADPLPIPTTADFPRWRSVELVEMDSAADRAGALSRRSPVGEVMRGERLQSAGTVNDGSDNRLPIRTMQAARRFASAW